jgi:hypothetical protein
VETTLFSHFLKLLALWRIGVPPQTQIERPRECNVGVRENERYPLSAFFVIPSERDEVLPRMGTHVPNRVALLC